MSADLRPGDLAVDRDRVQRRAPTAPPSSACRRSSRRPRRRRGRLRHANGHDADHQRRCRRGCGGWGRRSRGGGSSSRAGAQVVEAVERRTPPGRRARARRARIGPSVITPRATRAAGGGPSRCRSRRRASTAPRGTSTPFGTVGARYGNPTLRRGAATASDGALDLAGGTRRPAQARASPTADDRQRPSSTSATRIGGMWRWVMVGGAADDVGGDLEGVVHRRRRREAEPADRLRVAADDDDLAGSAASPWAPQYHM